MGFRIVSPLLAMLLFAMQAKASVINIQPAEAQSQDTFLYQGFVGTPSDSFFNYGNLGDETPYKGILGVSKTTTSPAIHNTISLLQFDLSALAGLTSSNVQSATLTLQSAPGLGFYEDPSASWPVTVDAYGITSAWNESTVSWSQSTPPWTPQPSISATLSDWQTVNSTSGSVSFNITQLLKDWISGAQANNGVELVQRDEVTDTDSGRRIGATFYSASAGTVDGAVTYPGGSANWPLLQVVTVPEPSTFVLMTLGISLGFGALNRRGKAICNA